MGLYQFHQRVHFHEIIVRIVVGVAIGSVVLAASYYFFPLINLEPRVAALAVLIALSLLFLLRFAFVRHIDENIFRRRTLVFGAGARSAAIFDLKRRADRRGFRIVGTIPAPGDTLRQDRTDLLNTGVSICDVTEEMEADEIPYYSERHTVKPGVTGWAQLKYSYGASKEDAIEKLRYDLYYVKNHSLLLDLIILLQSVEVILWRKGAR